MTKITVTFPDGSKRLYDAGSTPLDIARSIGSRLAQASLAAKLDDQLVDVYVSITKNCRLQLLTFDMPEGKEVFRHSAAHIFAYAVSELYPNAKNTIGPPVGDGFYYDFDDLEITPNDFLKIEAKMKEIITKDLSCKRVELSLVEAKKIFKKNKYKIEMASDFSIQGDKLSAYKIGDGFIDLCRGPHVPSTGAVKAIKLTTIAGAYWRGDQKNKQLTRVYGLSFPSQKLLDEYLTLQQEIERRDHRKIGQELDLFMFHEWSPGCVFFLPKGAIMYNALIDFLRHEYRKRGYQEVVTPQLFNKALWEKSGHWEHYKENMFVLKVDDQDFSLKPMNCPSHLLMYTSKAHSYRELPIRIADFCGLHRNELRGVLGGATRVRRMQQDDAHIFLAPEMIEKELKDLMDFVKFVYHDTFKMEFSLELSTKPPNALGDAKIWEQSEASLAKVLDSLNVPYKVNAGDGAFYGPKIDIHVKDALGRSWQCATIQLDFNMPSRFNATYEGSDNKKHNVVMIHRAILGSMERFIAVLTEHFAGKFPLWISPEQVRVIALSEKFNSYARKVHGILFDAGIRASLDLENLTVNKKIRTAQLSQINYILVVGQREEDQGTVNVRTRDGVVHGEKKVQQFLSEVQEEITIKK